MLDVHPPEEKIHGIRDFLLHLFTISVGLLIALALEGCQDRWHKHELKLEAEANLRQEIQDNLKEMGEWQPVMLEEQKTLVSVLDFLAAKKAGKDLPLEGVQLGFSIRNLSDASWRTAEATGALGLMEYAQVQRYAAAYQVQEQMMRLEQLTLDDFLGVQSYAIHGFDPARVSPADAADAEPEVRRALAHLVAMQQVAEGVKRGYGRALNPDAGR